MAVIWPGNDAFALIVPMSQWKHHLAISLDVSAKEYCQVYLWYAILKIRTKQNKKDGETSRALCPIPFLVSRRRFCLSLKVVKCHVVSTNIFEAILEPFLKSVQSTGELERQRLVRRGDAVLGLFILLVIHEKIHSKNEICFNIF